MKILLTGATGFIGSHILKLLIHYDFELAATCRSTSCISSSIRCKWINVDNDDWFDMALRFAPDVVIHAAWSGVDITSRNNWYKQIENVTFQQYLLELQPQRIIVLGSQSEYGIINTKVNEDFPTKPVCAYGAVKLASLEILRSYCEIKNIAWYWFRLFSTFGEGENSDWLIPTTVKKIKQGGEMDCTYGEQHYSYLYVGEVAKVIVSALYTDADSGVYNLSSNMSISIRELMEKIRDIINPDFKFNFGAIPYRKEQSMFMLGDNTKLCSSICNIDCTHFDEQLKNTINSFL